MIEHEGMMYAILKKYNLMNKKDDYIDICYIGYVRALKNFDESKSKLQTYIYACVENELRSELRKENQLKRKKGEEVSIDFEYCDTNLQELISDGTDIQYDLVKKEENEELYKAINKLSAREQFIIINMFKLGKDNLNNEELIKSLGITKQRLYAIKDSILIKLKNTLRQ